MPQPVVNVERVIGPYRLTVSGSPTELESLVRVLDDAAAKLAEKENLLSSTGGVETSFAAHPPQLPASLSLTDAIAELFASDWGKHPRKMTEVQEALAVNGLRFPVTSLSGKLLKLTRRAVLRRFKDDQGGYLYVRGSTSYRGTGSQ
jgi:hypothetical protein